VTSNGVVPFVALASTLPRVRRRALRLITTFAGLTAVAAALLPLAPPAGALSAERWVTIRPETHVADIATQLADEGVVRNARAFEALARLTGTERSLRAGSYRLSSSSWAWKVLWELRRGQVQSVSVTLPEGLTLSEVAATLDRAGVAPAQEIIHAAHDPELLRRFGITGRSAAGFLFPETYVLAKGLSPTSAVETLLRQFFSRNADLVEQPGLSPQKLHDKVVLASILERETKDRSELKRVAGVFQNRLLRGMRLESCATVQYALGGSKEQLTLNDVRTPSPFNTYLHSGLPPEPIANPGRAALEAAFSPEQHDYLFFFAREDGSGRHVFSRTYEEHKSAQRKVRGKMGSF
jgi:UPF0755 protein